ncbi:hypothetical protein LPB41_23975 [Thalassospira sp. MA62]|nr:hypothetical protein [Thalassospira sp. MA62]
MSKLSSKAVLILLFLISLFIGTIVSLIKFKVITLESSKLDVSDIINLILTFITLLAVFYTSVAALSAKNSADLLKLEYDNKHMPKLMPIIANFKIPRSKINQNLLDKSYLSQDYSNLNLELINVFQGNAYMVSTWLEISPKDILLLQKEKTPMSYIESFKEEYQFNKSHTPFLFKLTSNNKNYEYFVFKSNQLSQIKPVVKTQETIKINFPSYVSTVLLHSIYKQIDDFNSRSLPSENSIKLQIEYKTSNELDTEQTIRRTYSVLLNTLIAFPEDDEINFDINYKFLSEKIIDK